MNSCIERLVSINNPCGETLCTGIYDVTDVLGFTWPKAASIAEGSFKEYTGYQIAQKVRRLSAKSAMSDIMAQFYLKGWATGLTAGEHIAGEFKTNTPAGSTYKRGIQIKSISKCGFSGMRLKSISIKGCTDLTTTLYVQYDTELLTFDITLQSNKVLTLVNLCDANGVNIFATDSGTITIWIEDEDFHPYEVKPKCLTCGGGTAVCANSKGWINNGGVITENKSLAYGITATVACECDYDKILCALPNDEFKAQIIRYKMTATFADFALNTTNFNYWDMYGREETALIKDEANAMYSKRINEYVASLYEWLTRNNYCKCIKCDGSTNKALV